MLMNLSGVCTVRICRTIPFKKAVKILKVKLISCMSNTYTYIPVNIEYSAIQVGWYGICVVMFNLVLACAMFFGILSGRTN